MPHQPTTPRAPTRAWDRATWNQLAAADLRLIDELAYLSRQQSRLSPTGAKYAHPSRKWLASRLACSVRTITNHTNRLSRLGLLDKTQRRPINGRWQTNLYRLIHPMAWAASRLRHQVQRITRRLQQPAHLASTLRVERPTNSTKESLRDVLARGRAKFCPT